MTERPATAGHAHGTGFWPPPMLGSSTPTRKVEPQ